MRGLNCLALRSFWVCDRRPLIVSCPWIQFRDLGLFSSSSKRTLCVLLLLACVVGALLSLARGLLGS